METLEYRPSKSSVKLIAMPKAVMTKLLSDETTLIVKSNLPSSSPDGKSASPSLKCSKCYSPRVVTGSISNSRRGRCFFAPAALKFWTITKSYGTKVESYACLNCGLVWMQTSPKMLEDFVRNYCEQKID